MRNATKTWNPWQEFDQLQSEMGRLFGRNRIAEFVERTQFPAINLSHDDESLTISAELPGFDPESLDVNVQSDTVTISGERKFASEKKEGETERLTERFRGSFSRTLKLPYDVDSANSEATYRDGVLELVLHRPEEHKPKKLEVKRG